jgi:hypothetical protein
LCRRLTGEGWHVGIVPSQPVAAQVARIGADSGRPLLVVVDGAETTMVELTALAAVMGDRPGTSSR